MESGRSLTAEEFPQSTPALTDTTTFASPPAGVLPGGSDFLSPEKQRWRPALSPLHSTCQRLVGPRKLEPLFERKYLVSKQGLLYSDYNRPALRKISSDDGTPLDKTSTNPLSTGCATDARLRGLGCPKKTDRKSSRGAAGTSPCTSPSTGVTLEKPDVSGQRVICRSNPDPAKAVSQHDNATSSTSRTREDEHLLARKSDNQPVYACMERAVDLFLDHGKLLEDLQRVQFFGPDGSPAGPDATALQAARGPQEADAAPLTGKASQKKYVASCLEPGTDLTWAPSPSSRAGATTPASSENVIPGVVDAPAVGALNSVSVTKVAGTEVGSHVVLTALEWERFKRTVTNLITANLELKNKLQLTQRHFRSLGYSGNLEQTLAKLKSEELRVRRELALRETEFADSFTLSAKLLHHKSALSAAERSVRCLKDHTRDIDKLQKLLKQVKEKLQPQGWHGVTARTNVPAAGGGSSTPASRSWLHPSTEPAEVIPRDSSYVAEEAPYVEIHKCVRIAANKCFIVCVFVPANALEHPDEAQQHDRQTTDEPQRRVGGSADTVEPFPQDQKEQPSVLRNDSTALKGKPSETEGSSAAGPDGLSLKQVGQLFLRRQMEEAISLNSDDVLLVVYNGETSDANIQRLTVEYRDNLANLSRPARLRAAVKVICRNLRLSTLPYEPDGAHANRGMNVRSDATRCTLKYTRSAATEYLTRQLQEKARAIVGEEVDETAIYDANDDLLYVGCRAMSGCPRGEPRHYLIRLYRCSPRYLVARAFSPRSAVLHSCWIDAHWAMQMYSATTKCTNFVSTPVAGPEQHAAAGGDADPDSRRHGGTTPQYSVLTPRSGAVTPQCQASAARVERATGKRALLAAVTRQIRDAEGGQVPCETELTPSFIRFVASSLTFTRGKLDFSPTAACGTEGTDQQLLLPSDREHSPCSAFGGRSPTSKQHRKNKLAVGTDSNITSRASSGAEIDVDLQPRVCDYEGKQNLQCLTRPPSSTPGCEERIYITHAQVVQRSSVSHRDKYEPCFMLIKSCVRFNLSSVTFVVYEPASSWCAESSFSLLDALTMLRSRQRTFLQNLDVDKRLLKEVLPAVSSSASKLLSSPPSREIPEREQKEVGVSHCAASPRGMPYQGRENFLSLDSSRSVRHKGFEADALPARDLASASPGAGLRQVDRETSGCAQPANSDVRCEITVTPSGPLGQSRRAETGSGSGATQADEESGDAADNDTARRLPPSSADRSHTEEESRRGDAATASILMRCAADEGGIEKGSPAATDMLMPRGSRTPGSFTPRSEMGNSETADARKSESADDSLCKKLTSSERVQMGESNTFGTTSGPSVFRFHSTKEHHTDQSGAANNSSADPGDDLPRAAAKCAGCPAAGGSQHNNSAGGITNRCLSAAQWRSLLQEMFAGLKVCGNNIVIPGLPTVSVPGLWKILTE